MCVEYASAIKTLRAAAASTSPSSRPQKPFIFRQDARQPLPRHKLKSLVGGQHGESGLETPGFVVGESTKSSQGGNRVKGEQESPSELVVDTVLTSPPYPGVYNYLSHARLSRSRLGLLGTTSFHRREGSSLFLDPVPSGRNWASDWVVGELSARSEIRRRRRSEASSDDDKISSRENKWENDQRDWLLATTSALRVNGRLCIMIGDGDGIDTRSSLLETVEKLRVEVALGVVGWVTLRAAEGARRSMRTEHLVLLEKS